MPSKRGVGGTGWIVLVYKHSSCPPPVGKPVHQGLMLMKRKSPVFRSFIPDPQ